VDRSDIRTVGQTLHPDQHGAIITTAVPTLVSNLPEQTPHEEPTVVLRSVATGAAIGLDTYCYALRYRSEAVTQALGKTVADPQTRPLGDTAPLRLLVERSPRRARLLCESRQVPVDSYRREGSAWHREGSA
jgi:hypothetical protein